MVKRCICLVLILICSIGNVIAGNEEGTCDLGQVEKSPPQQQPLDMRLPTPLSPSGQPILVTIYDPENVLTPDPKAPTDLVFNADYYLGGEKHVLNVISWKPSEPKTAGSSPAGVLTLAPVSPHWFSFLPSAKINVLVCDKKKSNIIAFGSIDAPISVQAQAIILSLVFTIAAYVLCAWGNKSTSGKRWLNPIWLARDFTGRASLSQMQIIFFSVIVLFLVTYILLGTGVLASLSQDVLLLLGIAGLGSVAGKIGTYGTNRLDYENIAWAIRMRWMKDGWQVEKPKTSDLVTTGGEFDPYKFQMLIFSTVVGVALLILGVTGLAGFAIPPSLLGIIGLSQVTYVSGKVFANGSMGELNNAMNKLRKDQESDQNAFKKKVADVWLMFKQQIPAYNKETSAVSEPNLLP